MINVSQALIYSSAMAWILMADVGSSQDVGKFSSINETDAQPEPAVTAQPQGIKQHAPFSK